MAVSLDTTSTAPTSAASRSSASWAHTVAVGATVLDVLPCYAGGGTVRVSAVTWTVGGTTYALERLTQSRSSANANNRITELWFLRSPVAGAGTITVTLSAAQDVDAAALSWFGTSTSMPHSVGVAAGSASAASDSLSSPSGGDFVIAAEACRSTTTITVGGTPTTVLNRVTGAFSNEWNAVVYRATPLAASFSWAVADEHAALAVPVIAATGVGGKPTSVIYEAEWTAGVWTDVSSVVRDGTAEIHQGRDASGVVQPGTLDLVVDNFDGSWTPDNPTSTLWPNLVEGKRFRVRATKGAASSVRFVGRFGSIVPVPAGTPAETRTQIGAYDLLGELQRMGNLPTASQLACEAACRSGSGAYYPMTDAVVSTFLAASFWSTGADHPNLTPVATGVGSVVAYGADDSFPGGGDGCVSLTAAALLAPTSGSYAQVGGWVYLSPSSAQGIVFYLGSTKPNSYGAPTNGVSLVWAPSGAGLFMQGGLTTVYYGTVTAGWHYIGITGGGTSTLSVTIDGSTSAYALSVATTFSYLCVGGAGTLSFRDLCTALPTVSIPGTVFDLNRSLQTITADVATMLASRGLSMTLAWSDTTDVSTQPALMPAIAGKTALEVVQQLANSQSGIFYAAYSTSASQTLTLLAKRSSRPTSPTITLDIEADVDGTPSLARDVYGKRASATANGPASTVTASDLTASPDGASVSLDTALKATSDLHAVATDALATSKAAKLRVSQVPVDLVTAAQDLYATLWQATVGSRVRLRVPPSFYGVTYLEGYLQGWVERPGEESYSLLADLIPADAPPEAVFDSSDYGRFAANGTMTLTAGIAAGATSAQLTTSGSNPTLTVDVTMYPLDLVIDGEFVTVVAAPASAVSPQTVTIVRGIAPSVAAAHSAGAAVEVRNAASFAL